MRICDLRSFFPVLGTTHWGDINPQARVSLGTRGIRLKPIPDTTDGELQLTIEPKTD